MLFQLFQLFQLSFASYAYESRSRYRPTPQNSTAYQYLSRSRYRPAATTTTTQVIPEKVFENDFLKSHNQCRTRAGVEDVSWDSNLEDDARTYATYLSNSCTFAHSPIDDRPEQGENLYWISSKIGNFDSTSVEAWCNEPLSGTNHHTQVAWPTSINVGCASVQGPCGTTVVCRYTPPGNYGSWAL
jgi:uncharacterized protein YkwD